MIGILNTDNIWLHAIAQKDNDKLHDKQNTAETPEKLVRKAVEVYFILFALGEKPKNKRDFLGNEYLKYSKYRFPKMCHFLI